MSRIDDVALLFPFLWVATGDRRRSRANVGESLSLCDSDYNAAERGSHDNITRRQVAPPPLLVTPKRRRV
jgi:hypothetical protein